MVQINFALREVNIKIVYYGPNIKKNAANIEFIHSHIPPECKGELTSFGPEGAQGLDLILTPLDIGKIAGMDVRVQVYSVPTEIYYNATRKLILQGADGIIFVADSDPNKKDENNNFLKNLIDNLEEYNVNLEEVPHVFQLCNRDHPNAMSVEQMNSDLNHWDAPTFEATVKNGEGVFETFKSIVSLVREELNREYGVHKESAASRPTPEYKSKRDHLRPSSAVDSDVAEFFEEFSESEEKEAQFESSVLDSEVADFWKEWIEFEETQSQVLQETNHEIEETTNLVEEELPVEKLKSMAIVRLPVPFKLIITENFVTRWLAGSVTNFNSSRQPIVGGYTLLAELGFGGMAYVFLAQNSYSENLVAMKILKPEIANDNLVYRFKREANVAMQIVHPNCLRVFEVGEDKDAKSTHSLHYMISEFVHGLTAKQFALEIKAEHEEGLPILGALQIVKAALEGLVELHSKGIVHRDIKPSNILIPTTDNGKFLNLEAAKLADFGLAKRRDATKFTATKSVLYTAGYSPPEQYKAFRKLTPSADVFSMGATLYSLLVCRRPFEADTIYDTVDNTRNGIYIPIRMIRRDVSRKIQKLINKCLNTNPQKRFPNAGILLSKLESLVKRQDHYKR